MLILLEKKTNIKMLSKIVNHIKQNRLLFTALLVVGLVIGVLAFTLLGNELARAHDSVFHAARLANYYLALKQGQFPPRLAPNLNYGFGYPVFNFIYQPAYFLASIFFSIGASIELSLNLVVITSIAIAGISMVLFAYKYSKSVLVGMVSSLMYLLAPYNLLNIYVRNAIGEITFFGLLPVVLIIIINSSKKKVNRKWQYLIIGLIFSLFLLSHPLSLMVGLPIILIWVGLKIKNEGWKFSKKIVLTGLASGLIVQFFWMPFLMEKQFIRIDNNQSVREYYKEFPKVSDLIWSKWEYGGFSPNAIANKLDEGFSVMIGFSVLMVVLTAIFMIFKKEVTTKIRRRKYWEIYFWLSVFFASLFLMMNVSKFVWEIFSPLKFLQFPWRLLWLSVFSGIMVFINLVRLKILNQKKINVISVLIIAICFYRLFFNAKPIATFKASEHEWLEYPNTADAYNENMPIWFDAHKNLGLEGILHKRKVNAYSDNIFDKKNQLLLEQPEKLESKIVSWTGSEMEYQIDASEAMFVLQRTAYFPGWEVYVDGKKTTIEVEDKQFPGRIVFKVNKGKHNIKVMFTNNTTSRKLGDILFGAGLVMLLGIAFIDKKSLV